MSDPMERLSRFGSEIEGGPMPLPPAEIRRRGDRIRRRNRAMIAGGATLAAALIAAPVLAMTGGAHRTVEVPPADQTDGASSVVTESDLLGDDDTVYSDGADWFVTGPDSTDREADYHPCARRSLASQGAVSVRERSFELRNTSPDGADVEVRGDAMDQVVAQFITDADARQAYSEIQSWVKDCQEGVEGVTEASIFDPLPVDVAAGVGATVIQANYGPVPRDLDEFGDSAYITETGLAVSGDRLTVVRTQIVGEDYTFLDGTPMQRMLPVAVDLMRSDAAAPDGATAPVPDRSTSTFPDELTLASGWPSGQDYEWQSDGGRGILPGSDEVTTACGASPRFGSPTSDGTAVLRGPTQRAFRGVALYDEPQEAADALASLTAAFTACEAQDGAVTTRYDVSTAAEGEGWVRIGRVTTVDGAVLEESTGVLAAGTVGRGLLIVGSESEGGGTPEANDAALDEAIAQAQDVLEQLAALADGP
ncbi:hypothetical protein [Nocardioides sp. GY 10113]|uniref:hypothetical protein n=1 Tax=Nocardioides sp. GY 10113 TaxID=2569761 RepID=UPI0014580C48|nr:hypothetical protein [Nocardioides sp. GY 10113]